MGPESLEAGPVALLGPSAVGHYADAYMRTEEGWRFAKRVLHMAFVCEGGFPERGKR